MSKITFQNVSVLYEDKKRSFITAVDNVSFSLNDHAFHVFVGPSGGGKTSLIKCLTGDVIYEGKILLGSDDLESVSIKNRKISYMTQDYLVYPNINVYDNIAFPLRVAKMDHDEADQRIKDIAHKLDIDLLLTRKSKYLSIGQISRVALAKALVKDSELFLFDEPTKNLDVKNREIVVDLIKENVKKRNKTVVYVTHDIKEAINIADYIHVIADGKHIGVYTPEEFLNSDNPIVKSLRVDL